MNTKSLLKLLWQCGLDKGHELTFLPEGRYEIVSRGVEKQGAVCPISEVRIFNSQTGESLRGALKIDERSSQWREQNTVDDPQFDNVVLHLVSHRDVPLLRSNGEEILTCVMQPRQEVLDFFKRLPLTCKNYFAHTSPFQRAQMLSRLLDERIERKIAEATVLISATPEGWYECCFLMLFRTMGMPSKNKEQFGKIAAELGYDYITRHQSTPKIIEARILGDLGYLDVEEELRDNYTLELQRLYIANKNAAPHLPATLKWNNVRVRPSSLPALALMQTIALLTQNPELFDRMLEFENLEELRSLFNVEMPLYWQSHSAPSKGLAVKSENLSTKRLDMIILNFAMPMLLAAAKFTGNDELWERVLALYEQMECESFGFLREWSSVAWHPRSAFDSQALVQLKTEYCARDRCANCPVGSSALVEFIGEL